MGTITRGVAVGILLGFVSGCTQPNSRTEGVGTSPQNEGTSDEVARFEVQNFAPC